MRAAADAAAPERAASTRPVLARIVWIVALTAVLLTFGVFCLAAGLRVAHRVTNGERSAYLQSAVPAWILVAMVVLLFAVVVAAVVVERRWRRADTVRSAHWAEATEWGRLPGRRHPVLRRQARLGASADTWHSEEGVLVPSGPEDALPGLADYRDAHGTPRGAACRVILVADPEGLRIVSPDGGDGPAYPYRSLARVEVIVGTTPGVGHVLVTDTAGRHMLVRHLGVEGLPEYLERFGQRARPQAAP